MMNSIVEHAAMDLAIRFAIDISCMLVLIRVIYFRAHKRSDLFLTFFSFNLVIFLIAYVLSSAEISMGAAFGLFAVFSMLRYRTEGISTTDMTYLFLGVALGLVMAIAAIGPLGLAAIGGAIVLFTRILEGGWLANHLVAQEILYDRIELIHADRREDLIADLRERTGLIVQRVEIREIDLVRDMAKLTIHYPAGVAGSAGRTAEEVAELKVISAA